MEEPRWRRPSGPEISEASLDPDGDGFYYVHSGQGDWATCGASPQEAKNPYPAPFLVELAQRCISATDARIVLDPFMGSGSTAIAAIGEHREWIRHRQR